MTDAPATADNRPRDCRFRLRDEGKPYSRSSCSACNRNIATGLGRECHYGSPTLPTPGGSDETV